ncbi:MAG: YmdB family metallophosphoesterase [Alphaproteobacteria bacterium]|nr:YmdB family metallophosphoesterase [Alphaproteobacteria bacterium]
MKILFFGDVMGRRSRTALLEQMAHIKGQTAADVVIVDADNAAHGYGLTPKVAADMLKKIDVLTIGDHTWDHENLREFIKAEPRLVRPANWHKFPEGSGASVIKVGKKKLLVISLLGTLFMHRDKIDNPFETVQEILKDYKLGKNVDAIFVDFHAETTSEKVSLANFLDGKITALIGSHTHIPTCDERILPAGTAFQTDAGMCGDFDSSIGMDKGVSMRRFMNMPKEPLRPAEGDPTLNGTLVEVLPNGLAKSIKRVRFGKNLNAN